MRRTEDRPPTSHLPQGAQAHLPCSSLTHPLPLPSRRPSVSFGGFGLTPPIGGSFVEPRTLDGLGGNAISVSRAVALGQVSRSGSPTALGLPYSRPASGGVLQAEQTEELVRGEGGGQVEGNIINQFVE